MAQKNIIIVYNPHEYEQLKKVIRDMPNISKGTRMYDELPIKIQVTNHQYNGWMPFNSDYFNIHNPDYTHISANEFMGWKPLPMFATEGGPSYVGSPMSVSDVSSAVRAMRDGTSVSYSEKMMTEPESEKKKSRIVFPKIR